jgi:ferredoxin-thioredoxin reductase catalytic subunit
MAERIEKGIAETHPGRTRRATLDHGKLLDLLKGYADAHSLQLNPHHPTLMREVEGLLYNLERYGYIHCPCRVADITGDLVRDKRLSCPCAYHVREIQDVGYCKCELFVSPLGSRPDLISTTIHRLQVQRRIGEEALVLHFVKGGWSRGEVKVLYPQGFEFGGIEVESDGACDVDGVVFEDRVLFFYFGFRDRAEIRVRHVGAQ